MSLEKEFIRKHKDGIISFIIFQVMYSIVLIPVLLELLK